jgi:transposase-like protein
MNQATALDLESDQNQGKKGAAATRWRRLVEDHRVSGLPVSAFCRDRGISPSSLFAWRRRLVRDETGKFVEVTAAAAADESRSRAAADFGAAHGRGDASINDELTAAASFVENSFVELRLRGDRRLILRRGFDRQLLLDLLAVLEGQPCKLEPHGHE